MIISLLADILLSNQPSARAQIKGSEKYGGIRGVAEFYPLGRNTVVAVSVNGLPKGETDCACRVFGLHVHAGNACTGNGTDPFANTDGHYDTKNCEHPCHAGDMPPLFGCAGRAWMAFMTDRFTTREIVGKTVVIHDMPDDFKTQPSGNSGEKIACGVIESI